MSGSEAVVNNNESETEVVLRKSIDDWRKRGPAPWKLGRVLGSASHSGAWSLKLQVNTVLQSIGQFRHLFV